MAELLRYTGNSQGAETGQMERMDAMNLIAAADQAWGIGRDGGLLTHLPGDMKYFGETTRGHVVVMGRKTLESFPGGKPLKNRVNVVLTTDKQYLPEGVTVCHSLEETLEYLKQYKEEDIFIIGGGTIYSQFLPYCKKAYVTRIHETFQADTKLENLDKNPCWTLSKQGELQEENGISYEFCIYERTEEA